MRIVEFQDCHTPPPSDDDDGFYGRRDSDSDSGDSNFNGYWPGVVDSGGAGTRPRTTRYDGAGDPRLGRGSGPAFQPRQRDVSIVVGQVACPVVSTRSATTCFPGACWFPGQGTPRGIAAFAEEVDLLQRARRSLSPVKFVVADPMRVKACLWASPKAAPAIASQVQSIDRDPRPHHVRGDLCRGTTCDFFEADINLVMGRSLAAGKEDGTSFLFMPTTSPTLGLQCRTVHTDLYLSGPEDASSSGPSSPSSGRLEDSIVLPLQDDSVVVTVAPSEPTTPEPRQGAASPPVALVAPAVASPSLA